MLCMLLVQCCVAYRCFSVCVVEHCVGMLASSLGKMRVIVVVSYYTTSALLVVDGSCCNLCTLRMSGRE